jgi:hypothetical protein
MSSKKDFSINQMVSYYLIYIYGYDKKTFEKIFGVKKAKILATKTKLYLVHQNQ